VFNIRFDIVWFMHPASICFYRFYVKSDVR